MEDTGVGIEKSEVNQLFSLYSNYESNRVNHRHGSGLGLHICQTLVSYLGPNKVIYLKSIVNNGSNFSFFIYKDLALAQ